MDEEKEKEDKIKLASVVVLTIYEMACVSMLGEQDKSGFTLKELKKTPMDLFFSVSNVMKDIKERIIFQLKMKKISTHWNF